MREGSPFVLIIKPIRSKYWSTHDCNRNTTRINMRSLRLCCYMYGSNEIQRNVHETVWDVSDKKPFSQFDRSTQSDCLHALRSSFFTVFLSPSTTADSGTERNSIALFREHIPCNHGLANLGSSVRREMGERPTAKDQGCRQQTVLGTKAARDIDVPVDANNISEKFGPTELDLPWKGQTLRTVTMG